MGQLCTFYKHTDLKWLYSHDQIVALSEKKSLTNIKMKAFFGVSIIQTSIKTVMSSI